MKRNRLKEILIKQSLQRRTHRERVLIALKELTSMSEQRPYHLALIAHDGKKDDLVTLVKPVLEVLQSCRIVTTATTGQVLKEKTGLEVHRVLSGPRGGDLQIGGLVAVGMIERLIFLRDPLMAHPHEPDIAALMKVCDIYEVPLATNKATADLLLQNLSLRHRS